MLSNFCSTVDRVDEIPRRNPGEATNERGVFAAFDNAVFFRNFDRGGHGFKQFFQFFHANGSHFLLYVLLFSAQRVPPECNVVYLLGVGGILDTRLSTVFVYHFAGEAYIIVPFDEQQLPAFGQFPDALVVRDAGIVPVGTQDNRGGFVVLGLVIFRVGVVFQVVAVGFVSLDYIVIRRVVLLNVGVCVVFVILFDAGCAGYVLVVYMHDDECVGAFEFFVGVKPVVEHIGGGVFNGVARYGFVHGLGVEGVAHQFEPPVLGDCKRGPGKQEVVFIFLCV